MAADRAMAQDQRTTRRPPTIGTPRVLARGQLAACASLVAILVALMTWLTPATARAATIQHVVVRGETLGFIAKRHGTSVSAIEKINGLRPGRHLYPGQKLLVPSNRPPQKASPEKIPASSTAKPPARSEKSSSKGTKAEAPPRGEPVDENESDEGTDPWVCSTRAGGRVMALPRAAGKQAKSSKRAKHDKDYARKPVTPGIVSLQRYSETFRGRLLTDSTKVRAEAREKITHLMRDLRSRKEHAIDDRLLKLMVQVSDHFGGRPMVVISGYRAYSPLQHSRASRHNSGQAVDFRIVGVPVEVLWEYCLGLGDVGVGYYPTSAFVHLDVRGYNSAWVDTSRPGQRPAYACRPAAGEKRARTQGAGAAKPSTPAASAGRRTGTATQSAKPSAPKGRTTRSGGNAGGKRNTASSKPGDKAVAKLH